MSHFVEVILPLALDKTFTYKVSEAEFNFIANGMRVAVPFGSSKIYTAIAVNKHTTPPLTYDAKEIHQILDEIPVVNEFQLQLWFWIASYYMCAIGDVYRAAMPSSLLLESETIVSVKKDSFVDESQLTDDEFLIYEALQYQSSLTIAEVVGILNKKNILPIIQKMVKKNVLKLQEEVAETYKSKQIRYIRLHPNYESESALNDLLQLLKGKKQVDVILSYFQWQAVEKKPISAKQLQEEAQTTASVIKALIDKEILQDYFITQDRTDFTKSVKEKRLGLSLAQQSAFNEITTQFEARDIVLLHGVTSSGKTEIYIKLIEEVIASGKQILFLLPEIALTTQLVSRLRQYFGNKIAVYHSKYNNNERVEVWNQVLQQSEKAQIVIGARSALFLPFSNLGLILVDEEHEANFKQTDPAPRYHARDTVTVLASYHQCKVLLGSATPSIESFYNAKNNKYGLVTLKERYNNVELPEIILVDLKDKYFRKKMTGHVSEVLLETMNQSLANGEQVILFQNRRGFAPLLECLTCGHIPQCPNCDVSLTYHKFKSQLKCHYCGHAIAKPSHCHQCSSVELTAKGFGTEQVEVEIAALFPTKKVLRMDQDTTRGKLGYEKIIDLFQNREVDILVGTQMLAKGLDFDNVGLVGIMNADNMLYFPDFRAFERSYQMMTQVAGRAGRSGKQGKVIIQTFNPNHDIIQQVTQNAFEKMYEEQLYERRVFKYPPFYKLIHITLKHRDFEKLSEASKWLYQVLSQSLSMPVLGPEEPAVSRIRNEYIRTILIKIPANISVKGTKKTIQKIMNSFNTVAQYKAVKITVNVDV
jgi:primosomal protein N' (replication factor Y)